MARALHLLKGDDSGLAAETITRQLAAGDTVSVVALPGAHLPALPAAVVVHRVPDELSYEALLDVIFAADQVITW